MKPSLAALEKALLRAAMRYYNYYERYTTPKQFTKGGEIHRMAHDHNWDKLQELEREREAACARLAAARKRR